MHCWSCSWALKSCARTSSTLSRDAPIAIFLAVFFFIYIWKWHYHISYNKYIISRCLHWKPLQLESFSCEMTCLHATECARTVTSLPCAVGNTIIGSESARRETDPVVMWFKSADSDHWPVNRCISIVEMSTWLSPPMARMRLALWANIVVRGSWNLWWIQIDRSKMFLKYTKCLLTILIKDCACWLWIWTAWMGCRF